MLGEGMGEEEGEGEGGSLVEGTESHQAELPWVGLLLRELLVSRGTPSC